jgi:hypothetical protein
MLSIHILAGYGGSAVLQRSNGFRAQDRHANPDADDQYENPSDEVGDQAKYPAFFHDFSREL